MEGVSRQPNQPPPPLSLDTIVGDMPPPRADEPHLNAQQQQAQPTQQEIQTRAAQLQQVLLQMLQQNPEWSRFMRVLDNRPPTQPPQETILPLEQPAAPQQQPTTTRQPQTRLSAYMNIDSGYNFIFKIIPLTVVLFLLFSYFYLFSAITIILFVLLTISSNEIVKSSVQKSHTNLLHSATPPTSSSTNSQLEEGNAIPPVPSNENTEPSTATSSSSSSTSFVPIRLVYTAVMNVALVLVFGLGTYRKDAMLQYLILYPMWDPDFYQQLFINLQYNMFSVLWVVVMVDSFIKLLDMSCKSVLVILLHLTTKTFHRMYQLIFKASASTAILQQVLKCHGPLYAITENLFLFYRSIVSASIWVLYFYTFTPAIFPTWLSILLLVGYSIAKVSSWVQKIYYILKSFYYLVMIRGKEPSVGQFISAQELYAYNHRQGESQHQEPHQQQGEEEEEHLHQEEEEQQPQEAHQHEDEDECCVICRCEHENPVQLKQSCNHVFCEACIDQWCKQQRRQHIDPPTCPICRTPIPQAHKLPFGDGQTSVMVVVF